MTPEEKAVIEAAEWWYHGSRPDGEGCPRVDAKALYDAVARMREARAAGPAKPAVTLRRYFLPSQNGEGWAYIVIGSDGFFSTVSDWGNYSFWWSHHGGADFREFLLRGEQSWEYFANKLCPGRVYDGEATARDIRNYILDRRRRTDMDRDDAREEWCKVDDDDVANSIDGFSTWTTHTNFDAPWEFHRDRINPQIEAFMKKVWPRFNAVLREELSNVVEF